MIVLSEEVIGGLAKVLYTCMRVRKNIAKQKGMDIAEKG
jgi:hypothetical protein